MSGIVGITCLVSRIGALNFFHVVPTTMRLNTDIPSEFGRSSDKCTRGQNVAPMGSLMTVPKQLWETGSNLTGRSAVGLLPSCPVSLPST